MSEPLQPVYRPGDVVNGHILGVDNQWYPVQPPAPPDQAPTSAGTAHGSQRKASYGEKFKRRWRVCWPLMLGVTALATLANLIQTHAFDGSPAAWMIDLVVATVTGGTLNALILCLIVALFPGEKRPRPTPPL